MTIERGSGRSSDADCLAGTASGDSLRALRYHAVVTVFTRRQILVLALTAFSTVGGCASATTQPPPLADPPATSLSSRYPTSDALRATLETHADGGSGRPRDNLFMTTWFTASDARIGYWTSVDPAGHFTMYRFTHDWGFGATEQNQLTEIQLAELQQILPTLPAADMAHLPPVEQLLLVSLRRPDRQWVTRAYNRTNLPAAVQQLFEVTGAPLQPADHR